jgi:hypothetical protein
MQRCAAADAEDVLDMLGQDLSDDIGNFHFFFRISFFISRIGASTHRNLRIDAIAEYPGSKLRAIICDAVTSCNSFIGTRHEKLAHFPFGNATRT